MNEENNISKLTDKQKRFCEEYMIDLNGTQAAIRSGYSENTAKEIGYENLTKPHIQNYLKELMKSKSDEINHSLDDSLKIDFDLIQKYQNCLNVLENDKSTGKDIEVAERTIKYIGTSAYNGAMDRVAKKLGFFEKDNRQSKTVVSIEPIKWVD